MATPAIAVIDEGQLLATRTAVVVGLLALRPLEHHELLKRLRLAAARTALLLHQYGLAGISLRTASLKLSGECRCSTIGPSASGAGSFFAGCAVSASRRSAATT